MGLQHDFGEDWEFWAMAEIGTINEGGGSRQNGLVTQLSPTMYSGFDLGMRRSDLLLAADQLSLWFRQPMRVESSSLTLNLPSGRTKDGEIVYQAYAADMTPESRQIDIGLSYSFQSGDGVGVDGAAHTHIGAVQSFNHAHVQGKTEFTVAARRAFNF